MPRKPRIEVTERNLQTGMDVLLSDPRYKARLNNPFNEPTAPIELKDDTRECRWFNAALASDHIWRNKRKGWDQVRPEDVADLEQIGGYSKSPEGFVVRGDRGQEFLMSMPKVIRRMVQIEKTRANNANMGNPNRMTSEVATAAGERLGDQAGEYIQKHIEVKDSYERIE